MVEHRLNVCKILSSIPSTERMERKEGRKGRREGGEKKENL
jgi:hypothetical protein